MYVASSLVLREQPQRQRQDGIERQWGQNLLEQGGKGACETAIVHSATTAGTKITDASVAAAATIIATKIMPASTKPAGKVLKV